jgi:porin
LNPASSSNSRPGGIGSLSRSAAKPKPWISCKRRRTPGSARRGIYAGFTFELSTYYEGRLYSFGLIPGRPNDLLSFVANHSEFSDNAVNAARSRGLLAHEGVSTLAASYRAIVLPGVNVNVGLSYTDHPTAVTYTRSTGSALNVLLNTIIFL